MTASEHSLLEQTKRFLIDFMDSVPNEGVRVKDIFSKYTEFYGTSLPYKKCGYKSLTGFLKSFTGILTVKREALVDVAFRVGQIGDLKKSDCWEPNKRNIMTRSSSTRRCIDDFRVETKIEALQQAEMNALNKASTGGLHLSMKTMNNHTGQWSNVTAGNNVDPCRIAESFQSRDVMFLTAENTFAIFITEVNSPFKFWFHLAEDEDQLNALMDNMIIFYDSNKEGLFFASQNISVGKICAAFYCGRWSRAQIIEILPDNEVKVFHVDYGSIQQLHIEYIRQIAMEFTELPKQAIRGCMDHLWPVDIKWSLQGTLFFLSLVQDKELFGKVTSFSEQDNAVYLKLIDTSLDVDIHINIDVVDRKYAQYIEIPVNKLKKRHFYEMYPTFDMLENGQYPSLSEVHKFREAGFDFNAYEETTVIPSMRGYSAI